MSELLEALVVLVMFVIRIGVPIAVTLAFGYWLEKKLRPREEPAAVRVHPLRAYSPTGSHCWDARHCASTQRALCAATRHPELPCWLALQVEGIKVREQCFTCAFYKTEAINQNSSSLEGVTV